MVVTIKATKNLKTYDHKNFFIKEKSHFYT